ncbi:MAG TPA: nucleoside hydrolase [Chloroflexota bacterium]|nr:nucleoside hydrolase [Chloroflexota bacterium]
MEKVLLDTDIGSDIDDAVCLAYLLAQPRCELLGITTVSGEPMARAKLASALCKAASKNVPIYPGAASPLLVAQRQPNAPQAARLDRWEHDTDFPRGQAVEFLRQTIRTHPGEVTLLAIGPLTNVALLFAVDPEIPALLRRLVMMIGWFTNRPPHADPGEWNALCDPHAAAIVYRTPVAVHRSVPLDVTKQVTMPAAEVRERFQAGVLGVVRDLAEVWFTRYNRITFHDPLAATTIFDDQICGFQRGTVQVDLASEQTMGMTRWTPGGTEHEVALEVNPQAFFTHYFSVFADVTTRR